mgnify:CR=1 FL=1
MEGRPIPFERRQAAQRHPLPRGHAGKVIDLAAQRRLRRGRGTRHGDRGLSSWVLFALYGATLATLALVSFLIAYRP